MMSVIKILHIYIWRILEPLGPLGHLGPRFKEPPLATPLIRIMICVPKDHSLCASYDHDLCTLES